MPDVYSRHDRTIDSLYYDMASIMHMIEPCPSFDGFFPPLQVVTKIRNGTERAIFRNASLLCR